MIEILARALVIAFYLAIPIGTFLIMVSGYIPYPYNWCVAFLYFCVTMAAFTSTGKR